MKQNKVTKRAFPKWIGRRPSTRGLRRVLLQSENRVDVKTETEVDVKAGIRQLLVVVRRQTADLIVEPREDEMTAFDARQAEKYSVAGRYFKTFHDDLKWNVNYLTLEFSEYAALTRGDSPASVG